jgi:hypothetical protein
MLNNFKIDILQNKNREIPYLCGECDKYSILPRDQYLCLKFNNGWYTKTYNYCLKCSDELYPLIKEKMDPAMRFYK